MVDHMTAVVEETGNPKTAAESINLNGHEEHGQGEKCRVDRRKLELMLQEHGDESGVTADEFFKKIMLETDTIISWPSKLKIGAKSKKDPHIKITGLPENIKKAKDLVAVKLESKANRVTLKMDVSHTDHSHIIGRRGQSINKIMDETNCHIHFPDSNRGSGGAEKSNQVSITGQPVGVEKARTLIRVEFVDRILKSASSYLRRGPDARLNLAPAYFSRKEIGMLPLVLHFEVPQFDSMFVPIDPLSPAIGNIGQKYDVTFTIKGRTQMGFLMAVRGSQDKLGCIEDAMVCLRKQLTGSSDHPDLVQLHLDVAPQHHVFLVGRSACNIRMIMEQTTAKIELPEHGLSSRNGIFTVTGTFSAVIRARTLLVDCLPLLLMFDLKEEEALRLQEQPERVKQTETKFNVSVTVKPKPKQSSKSVTIKSKENNAKNMYLTRLEILGNPMDPQIMHDPSPLTIQATPYHGAPWFTSASPSPSPLASPNPYSARSDSPVSSTCRTPPPGSKCSTPPGFAPMLHLQHHYRSSSFTNSDTHRRTYSAETDLSKVNRGAVSEGGSPTQSFDFTSPRRNSEPTPYADAWKTSSSTSQNKALGPPARKMSPVHTSPPSQTSTTKPRYTILEGTKNARSHQLLDSHGSNAASSFNSLASASLNFDRCMDPPQNKFVDYEKKKGMSTQLMARKVIREDVQVPTDKWSGLHLSKSVDFTALTKNDPAKAGKDVINAQSSSKEGSAKPELLPFNPSASMQVTRTRNIYKSPFSPEASIEMTSFEDILKLWKLDHLAEKFKVLAINDLETFMSLTKEDLREGGFEPLGVRKKIENAIEELKQIKQKAVRDSMAYKAQNFRVANPLDFNARSGRF